LVFGEVMVLGTENVAGLPGETVSETVARSSKGTFLKGHRPCGRKPKGTPNAQTWFARAVLEEKGVNPISLALDVVTSGLLPLAANQDAKHRKLLSDELRVKVLLELMNYTFPRLSSTALTGANGTGAVEIATVDVLELMRDPEMAAAAQKLALGITYPKQIEGGTDQ
jgi:hypothetical protein